jgi:class 3 adenylate cyclase
MPAGLTRDELATRAGVREDLVDRFTKLGLITAGVDGRFRPGDARRIGMVQGVVEAGLPLEGVAEAVRRGLLSLDFADSPVYERFATLTNETFGEVSARTGVSMELLGVIHEAVGAGSIEPTDLMREDELQVVPFVEIQTRLGFRPAAIERLLRAMADSLRRVAEAEAEWFRSEVSDARLLDGRQNEIADVDPQAGLSESSQEALVAIWHSQQAQTWMTNIVSGFEYVMARAGIHQPTERHPAICFLDITGYTRLTQERGDAAAAALAENLARLVKRTSADHGGRPVKWLGDGVMFYFRDPASGVLAALEMVDGVVAAGMPPAHVGVHAGPVVVQQGDYYGATVNLAARIAEYARPGEVLVSQAAADASAGTGGLELSPIGDVELKGVAGATRLFAAQRS